MYHLIASTLSRVYKSGGSPSLRPHLSTPLPGYSMLLLRLFSVAFLLFFSTVGGFSSEKKCPCKNPAIRREWRTFSTHEKAEWIRAVNCLSHLPHDPALAPSVDPSISLIPPVNPSSSYYDDLVYIHMDLNTRIHWTGFFLPFHRWYLFVFEESLKSKCGYKGVSPYWNWTIDAPNFYESSFWKDSDPVSGLGGWGNPHADFSVFDGAFSRLHRSYPSPHVLRPNFTPLPFDVPYLFFTEPLMEGNTSFSAAVVESILETSAGNYKNFHTFLEAFEGPHSGLHLTVNGDMAGACPQNALNCTQAPTWSPNDPLFFLHHAMIDKIWYDWQHRDPLNAYSFFGGSVQALESLETYYQYPNGGPPFLNLNSRIPADGLFPEVTIGDVMDTISGILCYLYE